MHDCADQDSAFELLRSAVRAKVAASGQVTGPVASAFWHVGEFGEGTEWQVRLRTLAACRDDAAAHLVEHHPWSNPEITWTLIDGASDAYAEWIKRTVS